MNRLLSLTLLLLLPGITLASYCSNFDISVKNYLPDALVVADQNSHQHSKISPHMVGAAIPAGSTQHFTAKGRGGPHKDNVSGEITLKLPSGKQIVLPYSRQDKRANFVQDGFDPFELHCDVVKIPPSFPAEEVKIDSRWFNHHVEFKIHSAT